MDKKGITYMKIIIPVMAAIVIIGGAIVYSTKQPKAQEVMAPIETEQSVVTESEVSEPAPQPAQPEPTEPEPTEPEPTEPEPTNPEPVETVEDLEDGINSTHTDIILGDDEYKGDSGVDALQSEYDSLSEEDQAAVNRIEENLRKKHPEWFTDTPSTGTGEGNYEHVGTPDNGVIPEYTIGESGHVEGGENATVY
ncbi:MAG: hypothetical protein OSJ61_21540 [Lachnospiraceae bacterium]|nr:hypothetical protein [Lachnospiraceae bacterium]